MSESLSVRASVPTIAAINGGLGGGSGNTAALLEHAARVIGERARVIAITLAERPGFARHEAALRGADALLLGTGTYWDSWSSLLQRFLEEATPSEGTDLWLGKPAAVLVTAHSVGGKGVLSRLQGVLCTLGCAIPPMSGLVVTLASQAALAPEHGPGLGPGAGDDLWSPDDLGVVVHNLLESIAGTRRFEAWPVDRGDPSRRWLRSP
ncbi:MAG: NAD(P)H-dependent oxidoreductase [Sandaracinaceae bacterium]|nr:NAD(P)H-dependent oxidoreductase [Sandaracinaceae bacterium]